METNTVSGLLNLISAAVTPVVLISACAALILGINNKHTGISDRMRILAVEYRHTETLSSRRSQILDEISVFARRFRLTWYALVALYGAVMLFTATTLQIIFNPSPPGYGANEHSRALRHGRCAHVRVRLHGNLRGGSLLEKPQNRDA